MLFRSDLVDPAIRAELRAQIYRSGRDRAASTGCTHARVIDGVPNQVQVRVEPLEPDKSGLIVVSFIARPAPPVEAPAPADGSPEAALVAELEQELSTARYHLSIVVDELASSNEELRSLTAELQSTNEELHSKIGRAHV